mmetsp:Transcript_10267/g.38904  ORF Transcript_10267/g.38904 Transcript_10267/m.38904 type:complete len:331 (+) Transcript_10267:1619-2611(+)
MPRQQHGDVGPRAEAAVIADESRLRLRKRLPQARDLLLGHRRQRLGHLCPHLWEKIEEDHVSGERREAEQEQALAQQRRRDAEERLRRPAQNVTGVLLEGYEPREDVIPEAGHAPGLVIPQVKEHGTPDPAAFHVEGIPNAVDRQYRFHVTAVVCLAENDPTEICQQLHADLAHWLRDSFKKKLEEEDAEILHLEELHEIEQIQRVPAFVPGAFRVNDVLHYLRELIPSIHAESLRAQGCAQLCYVVGHLLNSRKDKHKALSPVRPRGFDLGRGLVSWAVSASPLRCGTLLLAELPPRRQRLDRSAAFDSGRRRPAESSCGQRRESLFLS